MDSVCPERLLHVERVDDLPVLFACLDRLGVAELLDRQLKNHEHHFWKGQLTFGEVVSVWLAFLLSQGDHRLYRLEGWAKEHQRTLQALLGKPVRALDFHDDRLADVLDCLPQEESWQALEADLNGQAVRVYDLETSLIRIDTTTANSYRRRLRRYGDRPEQVLLEQEQRMEPWRDEAAIERAKREMGWQVYASNQLTLPLAGVVWACRGQYRIEDDWSRLKGRPLSLTPLFLSSERRMQGLVLLLTIALRVLTLLEWVVRRKLLQGEEKLKGLYPGQAGRQTDRPGAELLLRAFQGINLIVEVVAGQVRRLLTPLNALQNKLLALWDFPSDLYARLELHFAEPPPH